MPLINNVRLNTFYNCAFVCFVKQASILKRTFEMCIMKTEKSLDSNLSHVMQTLIRFSNRKLERCKTNISHHILIIQSVIAVELSKRNFHMKWRTLWAYFCAISTH